jgi:hypothetical protein
MPKANRFGFPGVTWDRRHGKWMVQIRLGHRNVRLGYLDDFDDARRVYLGAKVLQQVFDQPFAVSIDCRGSGPLDRMDRRPVTGPSPDLRLLRSTAGLSRA